MNLETESEPLLLTVPETARLLHVGKNTVYEMAVRNELPSIKVGRLVRIPRDRLVTWVHAKSRHEDAPHGLDSSSRVEADSAPLRGCVMAVRKRGKGWLVAVELGRDPVTGRRRSELSTSPAS